MLCVYDMTEAWLDEKEASERPLADDFYEVNGANWVVPRLQQHDFRIEKKVVLPPCGLPH